MVLLEVILYEKHLTPGRYRELHFVPTKQKRRQWRNAEISVNDYLILNKENIYKESISSTPKLAYAAKKL